ncbi:hypothetical protein [Nocardiopsis coralliicola]
MTPQTPDQGRPAPAGAPHPPPAANRRLFLIVGGAVAAVLAATVALSLAVPRLTAYGYTGLLGCAAAGFEGPQPEAGAGGRDNFPLGPEVTASAACEHGSEPVYLMAWLIDPETAETGDLMGDAVDPQLPDTSSTEEYPVELGDQARAVHMADTVVPDASMAYVGAVAENLFVVCTATGGAYEQERSGTVDAAAGACGDYIAAMEADGPR